MEVTDQEAPIIFSQMLEMFPNIPRNIIWQYIQKYSSDMKKCVEMLNLQSGKCSDLTSVDNNKLLNNYQIFINHPDSDNSSRLLFENNNETYLPDQLLLLNSDDINEKTGKKDDYLQAKLVASSSQNSHPLPLGSSDAVPQTVPSVRNSKTSHNLYNFNEPLTLHIDVNNDNVGDTMHSWRPNLSSDALCSDLFLTSPMFQDFQFNQSHEVDLNSECNIPEIQVNSVKEKQKSFSYWNNSVDLNHVPVGEKAYVIDVANHLHFQKSQMNAIRYEVIKAKIELSDLRETEEKLHLELKEKMQMKSVQDIEQLNKEIVDLRLECQCLCSEVYSLNDEVLLGEVDENYYGENNPTSDAGAQNPVNDPPALSQDETDSDAPEELERWQCSKCTFANHPDINTCEMCHIEKPSTRTQNPPFVAAAISTTSCYCHPKKESLSVKS